MGADRQTDRQTDTTAVLDLRVVDLLKDVFKSTVVCFEDGILGAAGVGSESCDQTHPPCIPGGVQ